MNSIKTKIIIKKKKMNVIILTFYLIIDLEVQFRPVKSHLWFFLFLKTFYLIISTPYLITAMFYVIIFYFSLRIMTKYLII